MRKLTISRTETLTTKVTERLRQAILDAEFALGEALSLDKLATELEISRTPVREALAALQQQGLVEIKPQRGSFVFLPSHEDLEQICAFRQVIEISALRFCFAHNLEKTLEQMERCCKLSESASLKGDQFAFAHADTAFHDAILENCTNHYLISAYQLASWRLAALRVHQAGHVMVSRVNTEHQQIVEALKNGNLTEAESVLTKHILQMKNIYVFGDQVLPNENSALS